MEESAALIYEDKNFLAVYKPANLLVHPVAANRKAPACADASAGRQIAKRELTLTDWLIKKYPEIKKVGDEPEIRPGIVHRLDRDTSGVILIARNQKYFEYLKHLFQTHQIKKTYLALVYGELKPKTGVIKKPIRLKSGTIKRTVWKGKMEKEAITEYKVLKILKNSSITNSHDRENLLYFSFLRVLPRTGRTHQIRVHLSSIGHPVVGDSLYGPKENPFDLKRLFLHAESLEFSTAEGQRIKIESELPKELKSFLKILKSERRTKFF